MFLVGLALAAITGVFLRYGIDSRFPMDSPHAFPWHTFAINTMGSFLIGSLYVLASEKNLLSESWRLILTTGLLGSFTTFSAFSIQNILLIQDGKIALATGYSLGSLVAGIAAAYLGILAIR